MSQIGGLRELLKWSPGEVPKNTQVLIHMLLISLGLWGKWALLCLPQGDGIPLASQCMGSWKAQALRK